MRDRVIDILEKAGIENSRREAEWLIEASPDEDGAVALAARRAAGEPLQYLTGVAGFRYLELEVGPGCFIPRPETELVAERAMELLPQGGTLVDVGTGSGAIALAVASERPDARVIATEVSLAASAWAERNAERVGVQIELVHCDLLDGLDLGMRGRIDVIVSNPPYIAPDEALSLAPEVREHEPSDALFAEGHGFSVIERLLDDAPGWLTPGGWLVLEIGETQGGRAHQLLTAQGFSQVRVSKDLAGRERIVEGRVL